MIDFIELWRNIRLRRVDQRASRIGAPVARLRYLRQTLRPTTPRRISRWAPLLVLPLVTLLAFVPRRTTQATGGPTASPPALPVIAPVPPPMPESGSLPAVWLVEKRNGAELYSNGLRIETADSVGNQPRSAKRIFLDGVVITGGQVKPAGIVYHTTESHIAPFEPSQNQRLQRVGGWLRDYVVKNRCYHYLIDRFGRVHRIVAESDIAFHAGASIWGSGREVWVNLNECFLAVAFESETRPGEEISQSVTQPQIHSAALLTGLLRSRYAIPEENCVTHAQVSVNPANWGVGNHTDWAANFPFAALGLPDNYRRPLAAITVFGFQYDDSYVRVTGARLWHGLGESDDLVAAAARAASQAPDLYRHALRRRYREALAQLGSPRGAPGPSSSHPAAPPANVAHQPAARTPIVGPVAVENSTSDQPKENPQ